MGNCTCGHSSNAFPMYLMIVGNERRFLSLLEAGKVLDSGHIRVSIGNLVLEKNYSVREITHGEAGKIYAAADEHSASK